MMNYYDERSWFFYSSSSPSKKNKNNNTNGNAMDDLLLNLAFQRLPKLVWRGLLLHQIDLWGLLGVGTLNPRISNSFLIQSPYLLHHRELGGF